MSYHDMVQRAASRLMRQAAEHVDAPGRLARLHRARRRERVFVSVGAPVAAMLLIGLPLLLFRGGDSSYTDQATTTALEQTSTTIEQTTTTVEQTSTTIEQTTTTVEQTSTTIEQTATVVAVPSMSWQRVEPGPSLGAGDDANAYLLHAVVAGGPGLIAGGHVRPADDIWDGWAAEGGTAAIWTSSDGTTWDRVPQDELSFGGSGAMIDDITVGGPGYVAVGQGTAGAEIHGAVWLSEDGYSWVRVGSQSFEEGTLSGVTAGEPGIVAVGDRVIWFSSNGVEWQRAVSAQPLGFLNDVTYGSLGFVAVGSRCGQLYASEFGEGFIQSCYPHAWMSADGLNWERVDLITNIGEWPGSRASDGWVDSLAYAVIDLGDRVLIAGDSAAAISSWDRHPTFWTSTDGMEWNGLILEARAVGGMSELDPYVSRLVETEHGLIAVGGWLEYETSPGDWSIGRLWRAAVWVSADGGVTWSEIPPDGVFPVVPAVYQGGHWMDDVAILHGKLVGVGTLGTAAGVWIGEWSG